MIALLVVGGLGLVAGLAALTWWWLRVPFHGVPSLFTLKAAPRELEAIHGRVVRRRRGFLVLADVVFLQHDGVQMPASGEIVIDVRDLAWVQVGVTAAAVAAARRG